MLLPGQKPWTEAVETLIDAHRIVKFLMDNEHWISAQKPNNDDLIWQNLVDAQLLEGSVPYAWGEEPTRAVLAASKSIPSETALDRWNLPTRRVWWWFGEPLPWTPSEPVAPDKRIRALSLGWIEDSERIPSQQFGITAWIDDPVGTYRLTPSQTQFWRAGESLDAMLRRVRLEHWQLFGPVGKYRQETHTSEPVFMAIAEGLARFLLSALAWLEQKVIVERPESVERHRRKELERRGKTKIADVRVIQLRKTERGDRPEGEAAKREWTHRWLVNGHWRLQPCGHARSEKRLTWVSPYVKGPDDKPFVDKSTIYEVRR